MEGYAVISLLTLVLALFIVVALPVYCARQVPAKPFWKGYLWGAAAGAGVGLVAVFALTSSASARTSHAQGMVDLVVGLGGGAVWGAYMGVALAGLFAGPIPRQIGTQWGAGVALGLFLLGWLVTAWRGSEEASHGSDLGGTVFIVLTCLTSAMAVGGILGSQIGLRYASDRGRHARTYRRRR